MTDLRHALRALAATPIFTLAVVVSLALGIGANTAIFSIVDSLLLRALPVERPDRLVLLLSNPAVVPSSPWSNPAWEEIRDRHADLFEASFAFSRRTTRFNFADGGPTDFVDGIYASGHYFDALRLRPAIGRFFTADDDRRGGGASGPVAVISYALWQRRFGGAPDVLGKSQPIERVPFTIVGVMPPDFFGTDVGTRADVVVPIGTEPLIRPVDSSLDRVTVSSLLIMARLKDGQTLASAERALRDVQPQIREATMPRNVRTEARARYLAVPFGIQPAGGGPSAMRSRYRQPIVAIMAVVALVLLIACANVANLSLARAAARRHEFTVRLALGASRWRVARGQIVESLLLSFAGSAAGLAVARWATDLLVHQISTPSNAVFLDTHVDLRVLLFTGCIAIVVALLFGVVPAVRAAKTPPIDALRDHGRATGEPRRLGLGGTLVAVQVALSLVLVVAAALFVRTFTSLAALDPGFDPDPVLLVRLDVPPSVPQSIDVSIYERILASVRAVPGVAHAAVSEVTPVSGMITDVYVEAENGPPFMPEPRNASYRNVITPGWFATYGTAFVAGRDFDNRDGRSAPLVTIVNQTFVRRFLAGRPAIGHRVRNPGSAPGVTAPWIEIVGVVADATYLSLRDAVPPTMYVPLMQQESGSRSFPFVTLSVRAQNRPPALLARRIGAAVARVDPSVGVTFTPLRAQVNAALVQERIMAILSASFGLLALLLSTLGLYGVTAAAVNRRRMEIGIRMAIGATASHVLSLVIGRVVIVLAVGVSIGVAASVGTSSLIAGLLFGVAPRDPMTLGGAAIALVLVALLAGLVPAWRASRIDPAEVLRES